MQSIDPTTTAILESLNVAFVALDKEWRFTDVNSKAEELLRKPRAELLGKHVREELPSEVTAPFYAGYKDAVRTGSLARFSAHYSPLNAWLEVHVSPSDDGLAVYFQELTERKQTAEALLSSEQRFRAVWQVSADGMALSDAQGIVLDVNPAYLELYGYAYDEVVGHNFAIIFPEHFRATANEQYQQIFNSTQMLPPSESSIQCKDGTQRVVEARVDFIEENGERVAMLSSIRDITERVQQAEALRESEELFRKTFDNAPIGMAMVGLDFKPFRANAALCQFLGYSEEELTDLTAFDITHPEDIEADLALAKQLLAGEIPSFTIEKRYLTKSQNIVWAQLSATIIRDKAGNVLYALSMLEDITGRKSSEEERVQLLSQEHDARVLAERAVSAQEELLSLVSHDLRNPIAVVKGVTELLQRRIARGDDQLDLNQLTKNLARVSEAAGRMEKFVEDLSAPQHLQPGQPLLITPEQVDLVVLARRVAESHQQRTEQHQLMVEAESPELIGYWDPARLEQVLDNLITNAVKYSPEGGVVKIGVGYDRKPAIDGLAGNADAEQLGDGNMFAVVTVRDGGMGIPATELPHVFEWYRRGANVRDVIQGTGVGLAGARQIVEQHGGRITAESDEGAGSTFTVMLPLNSAVGIAAEPLEA